MNYFVKGNPDLCIGCRTCMIGCVVAHEGKHILRWIRIPMISIPGSMW